MTGTCSRLVDRLRGSNHIRRRWVSLPNRTSVRFVRSTHPTIDRFHGIGWLGWTQSGAGGRMACSTLASRPSPIQLLEIAVNPPLAERNAPLGREIGRYARAPGDATVQRDQAGYLPLHPLHPPREGVTQALDDLEQRQV